MELFISQKQGEQAAPCGCLSPGLPFTGCMEMQTYLIAVPCEQARLYVDDAPLDMDARQQYWEWQPGFYAGSVELELELPELREPVCYIVDVGPDQHKTGREQYLEYLQQIADFDPGLLLGREPAMHGLGGRSASPEQVWLEYARLRQFIGRYLNGLKQICARPIIRHTSQRANMPLSVAKRVDGTSLQQLATRPGLLTALAGEPEATDTAVTDADPRINVPFFEPTMDTPANRLVARQLTEVRRRVRALQQRLSTIATSVSETETDIRARLPRRGKYLAQLDRQLARIAASLPFAVANISKKSGAELNSVAGHPHYSQAHRMGIRLLRQGLSDLADDEQHALAPTWAIYEAWCFVALSHALKQLFPDLNWASKIEPTSADLVLSGSGNGITIQLYYQMNCRGMSKPNSYKYYSITGERRPDLVLEVTEQGMTRFICLDSKYSASRGRILDAMSSAHIYHDALRRNEDRAQLSLILVPANKELEELAHQDYWRKHGVGCYSMREMQDAQDLLDKLFTTLTAWPRQ